MSQQIPDRWENYKPIGNKIEGTRFIAFKVPLKEHISQNVDREIRLDGRILLREVPKLSLIIDLTNTLRYYNPTTFTKEGVGYVKLCTPGHHTPSKKKSDEFIRIVKTFLEENKDNDKLIGVHCTHGVNRTGYFICNYMISQMTIEPRDAINRFEDARGHKIERRNYINALMKLPKTLEKNWRIRKEPNPQLDNWRQSGNRTKNYHGNYSNRPHSKSPTPSSYSYRSSERDDYRLPNYRESKLRIYDSTLHQVPQLSLNYYRTRPAIEGPRKRNLESYTYRRTI